LWCNCGAQSGEFYTIAIRYAVKTLITSADCTTSAWRGKIFVHRKSCTAGCAPAQQAATMKSR